MDSIQPYNEQAAVLQKQYLSTDTASVHKCWLSDYLPKTGMVLDVGAGAGRDARYFAEQGLDVIAVEPAQKLKAFGQTLTEHLPVHWTEDTLPALKHTYALQTRFDLIVLSAVWMHIAPSQRERAFRKLSNLLKPGGHLIISLRHGPAPEDRPMHGVCVDELKDYASTFGLSLARVCGDQNGQKDTLNRDEVHWQTVVLTLPDDGSGAFPTIRNILINDTKSSTYKLALIRVLLRIADGHPGAVIRRENGQVFLPLGLVALFWAKQYKPLLDANLQQSSNANRGLGFITEDGWLKLSDRSPSDFTIGQLFLGPTAQAMHTMLKDVSKLIKDMPVRYITLPGTDKQVFEVDKKRTARGCDQLYTDFPTLSRYGDFVLPEKIWDLMTLYACWIEPVTLNEWVTVMAGYQNNQAFSKQTMFDQLQWLDPERSTRLVRQRVQALQPQQAIHCAWSHQLLHKAFEVDHCLPFSRWPNNDLWNLLPTTRQINNQKRDRIPSHQHFQNSKETILQWWSDAWTVEPMQADRFFAEARFSLPGLGQTDSLEDVFEAAKLQSVRLIEQQQLQVWH
ncbi:MAG: class I SAM-dependent methyltransferase [Hydrogenovibrio sp.]|uniref:class I SAM-dependent methyltransferase n=1 Tax=Hydrogenovibrio sp. TaxID=2065821 RepID=UPI0028707899|nr:class I SAM-dependent methyltransferase [Hydrogenovibrio sp.]MDR9500021.1 class I SAM-dependent methyltransferase [Hydrogenovibrio sp.]